ncbi:MAG: serine/threonine protein kinase [Planctomycetes bacterium]|nr:serine/threonine protein kinase [Planctomycetota bacterium]
MTTRTCHRCGTAFEPTRSPHGLCPKCLIGVGMRDADEVAPAPQGVAPTLASIAPAFPELDLVELIGQGGMGFVFRARHRELERDVALKLLAREHAVEPSFAERFRREARTLARLSHPGIVAIFDSGERGGWFYLVMEFVDGANLRHLMQSSRVEPKQALSIVSQVCAALQYSHDQGVVHRDVKPENVLVDREGRVKIADFGLARLADRDRGALALTGSQQVMGTLHYMAPEQWEHPQAVDHRADIYALGVVFYELLTGEMPLGRFDAPSKRVEIDVRLDEVVLKALAKQPERRYQQASHVQTDVDTIARSAAGERAPAPPPAASAPSPTLATGAWLAVALVATVLVCTSVALWHVARIHFADDVPERNGWWGAALGLGLGGLVAGITAHARLQRREDYARAYAARGLNWLDGAWALLACGGGVGLACAALSKPNHPATETLWLVSNLCLLVGALTWLLRRLAGWNAARRERAHAPRQPTPPLDAAQDPGARTATGDGRLFLFSLVFFVGVSLLCDALTRAVSWFAFASEAAGDGLESIALFVPMPVLFGLPGVLAGWHLLRLGSRTDGAWSRPKLSGFDAVIALFGISAAFHLVTATQLEPGTFPWWSVLTQGVLRAALTAACTWRRWSWWPRVAPLA